MVSIECLAINYLERPRYRIEKTESESDLRLRAIELNAKHGLQLSYEDKKRIAVEIPILSNALHQYTINWSLLSQGTEGVALQIDSEGDGIFEKMIISDDELTYDEFIL